MQTPPTDRYFAADEADIPSQRGLEVVVEGRVIGLFRTQEGVFAIDGVCPHSGGPLSTGYLSGTTAVCPWHGWQFDVRSGQHSTSPGVCQQTYPTILEDGKVYVRIPSG